MDEYEAGNPDMM
jgi:hypothetical protein